MDAAQLLLALVAKTIFLAMPAGTAWLAFRRLALSETSNAWIYAATGLFAAFAAAGLAPWALGLQAVSWPFFLFAGLCPPLWVAVVVICGIGRSQSYDIPAADETDPEPAAAPFPLAEPLPTLVLRDPAFPEAPQPVFRHRPLSAPPLEPTAAPVAPPVRPAPPARSVIAVARDMRGHASAERRRTRRLLPPPERMSDLPNLPFLPPGRPA